MSLHFRIPSVTRASLLVCAALLFSPSARAIVDFDDNAWSDIWETAHGRGYNPTSDDDGDGRTNWEEHNDGTDPNDSNSVRPVPAVERVSRRWLRFSWPNVVGKVYQLQVSFDGNVWNGLGAPIVQNRGTVEQFIDVRQTYIGTGPQLDRYTGLSADATLDEVRALVAARVPPAESRTLGSVETPQTSPDIDYFGERIRGWLIPPLDGAYVFWISGDRVSEFALSSNSSPSRLDVIARSEIATGFRDWDATETQKSNQVLLKRGRLYSFEAYQKATTGADHLSVAWTGPGLAKEGEVISGSYVTATAQTLLKATTKGVEPMFRVLVSDRDSDGDGLTDHEELTVGLDPENAFTFSRTADLATIRSKLEAENVVTIGVEAARAYEADRLPARFTFFRSGNINPLSVRFTVVGSAQGGQDFLPLSGVVEFVVGQTSAAIELVPEQDGDFEPSETVTATISPDAAYVLGASVTATVTIDDAADSVFAATLSPFGVRSGAFGTAALRVAGNNAFGDLRLSFQNLTSAQTSAEFYILGPARRTTAVLTFPPGQVAAQRWFFDGAEEPSAQRILAALKTGRLGVRVRTTRFPNGEIDGLFVKNWGWRKMQRPPDPGPALARARTEGDAARFLAQTSFGATLQDIAEVKRVGFAAWIDRQLKRPATLHLPYVRARREEILAHTDGANDGHQGPRQEAWWQVALTAPDQLRQRMAFALSEILVVSDIGVLEESHEGITNYYDLLVKHAFGNYRDLLEAVTLNPIMGQYLSMVRNEKANPITGSEPDENFAREVCQLFTVGVNQLHTDGTLRLSGEGLPIVTYTQDDVVSLARVFTGWGFAYDLANPPEDLHSYFRFGESDEINPMAFYPDYHDTGKKRIIGGAEIPANVSGPKELKLALDTLFQHPNVGPFIAHRLIQRFVTSNPSRGYTYRVASVFNNNGKGIRGDLGATLRAILLDPEARNPVFSGNSGYGKLREPLLRVSALLRAFRPTPPMTGDSRYFIDMRPLIANQASLKSPSVFNFFQPGYSHPGKIAASGLYSPEFQITSETSVIDFANAIQKIVSGEMTTSDGVPINLDFGPFAMLLQRRQFGHEINQDALINSLNTLLLGGQMSGGIAQSIRDAWASLPEDFGERSGQQRERVRMAVYIIAVSPEFSVQK